MGFDVELGAHALDRAGYLAGADAARAGDINRMLRDRTVRGIWFARGGYGTARLLDRIDWKALARDPKVLVGYSDVTALFAAARRVAGQVCLYGPVVSELGEATSYHAPSLRAMLGGGSATLELRARQVLRHGRAEGRVAGGNLTLLSHLLGTRYAPDLRGTVLFLEDAGEEAYRLDRLLNHLRMAGTLDGVAAVLIGSMSPAPTRRRFPPDRPIREILAESFLPLGIPVVTRLPAGHAPGKWTIPLGGTASLDTRAGRIRFSAGLA